MQILLTGSFQRMKFKGHNKQLQEKATYTN